jgi:hypothetical protein
MEPLKPNCRYIVVKPDTGFPIGAEVVYQSTSVSFDPFIGDEYTTHHFLEGDIRVYAYETPKDELRISPQLYFRLIGEINIAEEIARLQQQDLEKYNPKPHPYIP